MEQNKKDILTIEESWEQIIAFSKEKLSLHQIAFEIGVDYDTLKKHVATIALEKKVLEGNLTAIQIKENIQNASDFADIKAAVWEL